MARAPSWLDSAYIQTALSTGEGDPSITVLWSDINLATSAGDNYGSDMYRATVRLQRGTRTEDTSIIIKTTKPVPKEQSTKPSKKMSIFVQEINTFTIALPKILSVLTQDDHQFAAKYFYSETDNERSTIVLDDLKPQGFKLAQTDLGLDLKHCLLVIRKIARYHAASVVIHRRDPECFREFLTNIYTGDQPKELERIFAGNVRNCAKEVESWPDYKDKYAQKLHKMAETVMDDWCGAVRRNDSGFNVLTHGDLWLNNIMFRYSKDTGEVEDVRLVDFQLSLWTSPAVDLHYFLNSSASPDVLGSPEVLIEEYYKTMCDVFSSLGQQPPLTATQLEEELEKKALLGLAAALVVRAVAFPNRNKIADMRKVVKGQEIIHLSDAYKESIKKLLPVYEKRGWL